ncbi:MAG: hypothetical protein HYY78_12725 [Betaproteobacteria bacterium]|nr:hypothetical protein [Betaproteobacteria bacterium]
MLFARGAGVIAERALDLAHIAKTGGEMPSYHQSVARIARASDEHRLGLSRRKAFQGFRVPRRLVDTGIGKQRSALL